MTLEAKNYPPRLTFDSTVTILNGTILSSAVDLHGTVAVGFIFPAVMSNTTVQIFASDTLEGTYRECFNDTGLAIELAFKQDGYTCLTPDDLSSIRFLKIQTPGNENDDRQITVISRGAL